ncbi:unnamed protein product [Musa acuminata subsp. malaccensis]|uniref:(wild Malaysian banana) hypothetical protein n=1 Tax=Musa acuminata subsp. malaccensis TaxID=214687 RepID=A0A804I6M8_MUSAM|nr:unnamed protein product [Musa acuminata subsp. malaccensis]
MLTFGFCLQHYLCVLVELGEGTREREREREREMTPMNIFYTFYQTSLGQVYEITESCSQETHCIFLLGKTKPYDRINQTEKTRSTRIHSVRRTWYIASQAVDTCKRISGPRTSTSEHDQIRTLTLVLNLKKPFLSREKQIAESNDVREDPTKIGP